MNKRILVTGGAGLGLILRQLEVAVSQVAAAAAAAGLPVASERLPVGPSPAGDQSWLVMLHRALAERKAILPLASEGSRPS